MASDEQVQAVLNSLAVIRECGSCGTRIRFGDFDCPHCGEDLEDAQRRWAETLADDLLGPTQQSSQQGRA